MRIIGIGMARYRAGEVVFGRPPAALNIDV
jgi:hypothetical protein